MAARIPGTILLTVTTNLIVAEPIAAQDSRAGLGTEGIEMSSAVAIEPESGARKLLMLGGSLRRIELGPLFVVPEFYYVRRGSVHRLLGEGRSAADGSRRAETHGTLSRIEVPVLARVDLPFEGTPMRPYLQAGPVFAWTVSCGPTGSSLSSPVEGPCRRLPGAARRLLDRLHHGFVAALGADLSIGGNALALNVELRLTQGLPRWTGNGGVRRHAFSLMTGYSFKH